MGRDFAKVSTHETRRSEPVTTTSKSRINASNEVMCVCGDDTHTLAQSDIPSGEDCGESEHCEGEIFDGYWDDDESSSFAAVILGVSPDHGEDES